MGETPVTAPKKPPSETSGGSKNTSFFRKVLNNNTRTNILIAGILFLLLASGGFLVQNSILEKSSQEPPSPTDTKSSTPSARLIENNLPPVIEEVSVEKGKWPFNNFKVSWYDPENDPAMVIWCKTDNVSIDVGQPPGCPDGALIGPGGRYDGTKYTFTSAGRFNMTHSSYKSGEAYAFVCDNLGACSSSVRKTYSPVPRTGYIPGNPPKITKFEIAPQTVSVGQTIFYKVTIEDQSDLVRMIICKTDTITFNNGDLLCPGGAWSSATPPSFTVPTLIQTRREFSSEDIGTHTAFAFACDQDGHCSEEVQATFEVSNQ